MGQIPHMGFEPRQNPSGLETVNEFMKRIESATEEANVRGSLGGAQNMLDYSRGGILS